MRLIFLLLPFIALSQQSYDITKPMLGLVNDDYSLYGPTIKYCAVGGSDRMLNSNDIVIIAGSEKCGDYTEINFFKTYENGILNYIKTSDVSLSFEEYDRLNQMPDSLKSSFEENMRQYSIKMYAELKNEGIEAIKKHAVKGITIKDWSLYDSGGYTDGKDISIDFYNPTKKTIKYVWVTFKGFNPVDDVVVDPVRKTSSITVKAVGPIDPYKSGEYKFDFVWFTDLVTKAKIVSLKIQYMDGTTKTINVPHEVIIPPAYKFLLNE